MPSVASVLEEITIIIAWYGVWECCGAERLDLCSDQGVWRVYSSGLWWCRFLSPSYFATSMTSCGFCAWRRYDTVGMVRGVAVLRQKIWICAVIKGCGGCSVVISDGADFPAQHTLLQVCRPAASVLEKSTITIAWYVVWDCCGAERMDARLWSRGVESAK